MRRRHIGRMFLHVLPQQYSLRRIVPNAIQPPPLWSSSPSFTRHLHPHHSLAYVIVFCSQYTPIPLQPTLLTFLDISPTFVVLLILSFLILSSLVTPLHLNILISATSNFFSCVFFTAHVSARCIIAGLRTVLYTSPLDSQTYSSVAQNPGYPVLVFPSWLYSMRHLRIQVSILWNHVTRYRVILYSPYSRIDGSTDRCCIAIVTNERALLSGSDQLFYMISCLLVWDTMSQLHRHKPR